MRFFYANTSEVEMKNILIAILLLSIQVAFADYSPSSGGSAAVSQSGRMVATVDNNLSYAYFYDVGDDFVIVCNKFDCKK